MTDYKRCTPEEFDQGKGDGMKRKSKVVDVSGAAIGRAIDALVDERDALRSELHIVQAALSWCGGSSDFSPEGKAHKGWVEICLPLLKEWRGTDATD